MKIRLTEIPIKELYDGYKNNLETGEVIGYGGKLNIRPPYQREFIYDIDQQQKVMESIGQNFPLNVMYWVKNSDGTYELLDGQQRTLSICRWMAGNSSFIADPINYPDTPFYSHTSDELTKQIGEYGLMVYICEGTDEEILKWFKVINIKGEKLTDQELRNAVYTGSWLSDAKYYFSKQGCVAQNLGNNYMTGKPIRQEYLETVISWKAKSEGKTIEGYMAEHQQDADASELKEYFENMITWIKKVFPNTRKSLMQKVKWGLLYNKYKDNEYDAEEFENELVELLSNDEITNPSGVYEYLLSGKENEKILSVRTFSDNDKRKMYERQHGECPICKEKGRSIVDKNHTKDDTHWEINEMEADHIIPWSQGGRTIIENGQMLCKRHNNEKSDN